MKENLPNFYAIIPASVRYCNSLSANAKLLYGEITALCSREGFCWASNKYFAELYGVDERTAKRWIEDLKKENFIQVEVIKEGLKTIRKIWIVDELKLSLRRDKNVPLEGDKNVLVERDKNAPLLLQSIINTNKKEKKEKDASEEATYSLFIKKVHSIINKSRKERGLSEINPSFSKVSLTQAKNLLKINTMEYFLELCEYAMQDDFWWQNLKSMRSLQKHYQTFEALKYKAKTLESKKPDPEANYKFARKVEKEWKALDNPEGVLISVYSDGWQITKGQSQEYLPSYQMPHAEFKEKAREIFRDRGMLL